MVDAYILLQTEVGKATPVTGKVRGIAGVTDAQHVTGPYDVVVRAQAETLDELAQLVSARIQAIDSVTRTLTCPIVHL
ncbi:MAG: Lrp/AsnC ligand binding domain-containing protein [Planctomycetaceae bacterium]